MGESLSCFIFYGEKYHLKIFRMTEAKLICMLHAEIDLFFEIAYEYTGKKSVKASPWGAGVALLHGNKTRDVSSQAAVS
jgi:hypothetical protein